MIIIYMIIPGLPFSGGLLDNSATFYIDKLDYLSKEIIILKYYKNYTY